MTLPLYILTDARGYVTCVAAIHDNLMKEADRLVLHAPITVDHWALDPRNNWKHTERFTWP